ncbi:hypothetical protein BKA65DRAFT_517813 [Rhexocercosporidium sp. MPI-PUGE-AT-0058]|nr:hypothetical protein BKA65DRAFT_517813 [Rhexocercosporidium sp. MPI-PUGE-AT-0058]
MASGTNTPRKRPEGIATRSRGGCQTCRIRRVKCDETKPACIRCKRFGRVCDGYEVNRKIYYYHYEPTTKRGTQKDNILPVTVARSSYSPSVPPITIRFQDEQDEQYFRLFHSETCCALSGGFDTPLWSLIVLQACHDEPCILRCAVAIAALDRACKVRSNESCSDTAEKHHRHALIQYGKALKGVRDVILSRHDSLRTALIAALLIFCFESFHGDVRLALTNVRSAVDLLHGWLAEKSITETPIGFSPAPHIVEHDLVSAFGRLDVHLMSWIDKPPPQRNKNLSCGVTESEPIPLAFQNLAEAKTSFENLATRIFDYLSTISNHKIKRKTFSCSSPKSETSDSFNTSTSSREKEGEDLFSPCTTAIDHELTQWMSAFKPILTHSRTPEGNHTFTGAMTLRIHALTLQLSLRSSLSSTNTSTLPSNVSSLVLPAYCEIVMLSREMVHHPSFVQTFVFDSGILPSLFVVLMKCEDDMVRREALDVVKRAGPRREGVWDSGMVRRIGEEVLRREKEEFKIGEGGVGMGEGWVDIHLQCLGTMFRLPMPNGEGGGEGYVNGRGFLLDWVERSRRVRGVVR